MARFSAQIRPATLLAGLSLLAAATPLTGQQAGSQTAPRSTDPSVAGVDLGSSVDLGSGVDLHEDQHTSLAEAFGQAGQTLDDWIDRFQLSGFVAGRYFDTASGGARPDGALGIQAASLFVDVGVRDVARAFLELRFDYFQEAGLNQASIGEAYIQIDDVLGVGDSTGLNLRIGRFDLPFSEWYQQEDPNRNRMIGFPVMMPYRWDEGVLGFADYGSWGFAASISDGTWSRNSESGIAPAATLRLHARPHDSLYVSASGHYVHEADQTAICTAGSLLTPVQGGAAGISPSQEVRTSMAAVDVKWQPSESFHLHATAGTGQIDDEVSAFDRTFYWWTIEPSYRFAPQWQAVLRWSGVGTFDAEDGYQFEARPYGNGVQSYGFDLQSIQRLGAGVSCSLAEELVLKFEVGFDHLEGTRSSGLPNDTRVFTAAELVFTF
ncbi:MAG: hypothetical protein AB8H80_16860 [Planctomycetota bacterium]